MNDWASRRKSIYLGVIVLFFTLVASFLFWKFWYKTPTCFDNIKNGNEIAVDCGGSCSLVCSGEALQPIIRSDPRAFEVIPGVWSVVVYVENQNSNLDATYVPYTFSLYGENNELLATREGATTLPKNKISGIFEGSISATSSKKIKRATFELGKNIAWQSNTKTSDELSITHSSLLREDTAPRVEARVKNNSIENINNIELIASIFDGADNTIAVSRTFIDNLKKDSSSDIFFTWPKPFDLGVKVCEKPSNVALLLDRSGSMSSLGTNPPEPLTSVKTAATSFIDELSSKDRASVISFATMPTDPIDSLLSNNFAEVKNAINAIDIEKGSTQYTNVLDVLRFGSIELESSRANENSSKVLILLTDGIANYPKDPKGSSSSADNKYAEDLSLTESQMIKQNGISIYTIGLGKDINESFLKQISSSESNYFFSPSTKELKEIYKKISSSICKEKPVRIEISYKILK